MSVSTHPRKDSQQQTPSEKGVHLYHLLPYFKQTCEAIIRDLPSKYPTGLRLHGEWCTIDSRAHDAITVTLYGKRSGHGWRPTTSGLAPTTAHVGVPTPNPYVNVLLEYVRERLEGELEKVVEGDAVVWRTKGFQVDTHLTVYFELGRSELL